MVRRIKKREMDGQKIIFFWLRFNETAMKTYGGVKRNIVGPYGFLVKSHRQFIAY